MAAHCRVEEEQEEYGEFRRRWRGYSPFSSCDKKVGAVTGASCQVATISIEDGDVSFYI